MRGETAVDYSRLMEGSTFDVDVLAVRGEHIALLRVTEHGAEGFVGSSLVLNQVNEAGVGVANITFDEDDLEDAIAELDRRACE